MHLSNKRMTTLVISVLWGMAVFGQNITLNINEEPLKSVIEKMEKETTYRFLFRNADTSKKVSVNIKDGTISQFMSQLLRGTDYTWEVKGTRVLVYIPTTKDNERNISAKNTIKVKGTVKDKTGEPIIGATVRIVGKQSGVITDIDGNYTIDAAPNDKLEISFVGFAPQTISVSGNNIINVTMSDDQQLIDEVVVVGYGTQKKTDLTGSLTSVSGDAIVNSHKQNATAALQGTIAGVDIIKNGNNPGASFSIMVRGQNTIAAGGTSSMSDINPPLYIVDGMMLSSIEDIAPDDIERIDVLKDASSTAIYGSRGANGVVIVTTKKGRVGEEHNYVEYNGFISIASAMNLPDMMNGQEWADYKVERYMGEHWRDYLNGETAPNYEQVLSKQQYGNLQAGKNVDWIDQLLSTSVSQNHAARVYGNAKGLVYSFGLGYTNEEGVTGADNYKRYNLSASIERQISSKLKVGANIYTAYSITIDSPETVRQAFRLNGLADEYNDDGTLRVFPDDNLGNVSNPCIERENNQNETLKLHAFGNVYLQYEPMNWLTLKTQLSPDATFYRIGGYAARYSKNGKGQADNAKATDHWYNGLSYTWTNTATMNKSFAEIHNINAMVGIEWVKNKYDELLSDVRGFATDNYKFYNLGAGKTIKSLTSDYVQDQWMSYFTRVNYTLKDRYIITATGRYDGSSRLAKSHRWKFFPSAAIGWRLMEESWMKNVTWIDNLKLRLSYGVSGNNSNVNPYMTQANITNGYYVFGDDVAATTSVISNMANSNLSWETTHEWNFGIDFSFLRGRINGTLDLYSRRTDNILMSRMMSHLNGYDSVIDNIGEVDNRGLELSLNGSPVQTNKFRWNLNLNFTTNHNEIHKLTSGAKSDEANGWFVGESVGAIWTYVADGYWGMDEIEQAAKYGLVPGSIKVKEYNGDTSSTNADKRIIGNRFPSWTAGLTSTWTYKNCSLSAFLYTRQGQWSYSQFHWTTALNDNTNFNHLNRNYWTPENAANADWHRAGITAPGMTDAIMWMKTSYWKFGYITLGYDLPKAAMDALHLKKCHLYLSCQNPFIFTDYDGLDPEAADKATDKYYFMTRSFELGINLTF